MGHIDGNGGLYDFQMDTYPARSRFGLAPVHVHEDV